MRPLEIGIEIAEKFAGVEVIHLSLSAHFLLPESLCVGGEGDCGGDGQLVVVVGPSTNFFGIVSAIDGSEQVRQLPPIEASRDEKRERTCGEIGEFRILSATERIKQLTEKIHLLKVKGRFTKQFFLVTIA